MSNQTTVDKATQMVLGRIADALDGINASLKTLASGPTLAGQPNQPGLPAILQQIAGSLAAVTPAAEAARQDGIKTKAAADHAQTARAGLQTP